MGNHGNIPYIYGDFSLFRTGIKFYIPVKIMNESINQEEKDS